MTTQSPYPARGVAPGKVILLGEHAVVYGRPAVAAAIDRHVEVRITAGSDGERIGEHPSAPTAQALRRAAELMGVPSAALAVTIEANLPAAVGLGSSAALSVATLRAFADYTQRRLDDAAICSAAFELEKLFHGFPSGIDNTVATYGGVIRFESGAVSAMTLPAAPLPLVIVIGRVLRQTQQTVRALRARWESAPATYERLFDEVATLVADGEQALAAGDLVRLGVTMSANHGVLHRLGVSTDELDELVACAHAHGALGAKLTGGGGGGAVLCLCDGDRAALVAAFARAGYHAFAADIHHPSRGSNAGTNPVRLERYEHL